MKKLSLAVTAATLMMSAASAETLIFEDTFDAEPTGLHISTLSNWTVTGAVDVIGSSYNVYLWDLYPGNGAYLDLDGSCSNATIESSPIDFAVGDYELSFELGYNWFGSTPSHVLDVYVGDYPLYIDLDPTTVADTLTLASMLVNFSVDTETTASLRFVQKGAEDCLGAILDDVSLSLLEPDLPTDAKQCKKGGWEDYGVFKNQGDCVSFIATGGKNSPAL